MWADPTTDVVTIIGIEIYCRWLLQSLALKNRSPGPHKRTNVIRFTDPVWPAGMRNDTFLYSFQSTHLLFYPERENPAYIPWGRYTCWDYLTKFILWDLLLTDEYDPKYVVQKFSMYYFRKVNLKGQIAPCVPRFTNNTNNTQDHRCWR